MELEVQDRVLAEPSAEDVAAAVERCAQERGAELALYDDDIMIEARQIAAGRFRVSYSIGNSAFDRSTPVDEEALKELLLAVLDGDKSWRAGKGWQMRRLAGPGHAPELAKRGEPPAWAIATVVGSIFLVVLIFSLPDSVQEMLPFLNSTPGIVAVMALPMVALILAAIADKAFKVRGAKGWAQASAKVVRSQPIAVAPPTGNTIGTVRNEPRVEYVFTAAGKSYRGNRVSLGDDAGGANLEATLARYPVGAEITVYYDPADPRQSVIERDPPKGAVKGCLLALAFLAGLAAIVYGLFAFGASTLREFAPRAEVEVTLFAAGFGLAMLLFFIAYRRTLMRANSWPVVEGRVVESRVFERATEQAGRRNFEAVIEYAYSVGGRKYHSRQVKLGLKEAGSRRGAEAIAARYPEGATVEVHYDPANPGEAALENPTGASWLILAGALFCLGLALYTSHAVF